MIADCFVVSLVFEHILFTSALNTLCKEVFREK